MNQHFLNLIAAEPENRTHQLVYADWLEEAGDPRCGLIRMSESWLEYKLREGIRDWGMPGFDTLTRNHVLKASGVLLVWKDWSLLGFDGRYGGHFDITLSVSGVSHGDNLMAELYRHNGREHRVASKRHPELMPPGWIGHKTGAVSE